MKKNFYMLKYNASSGGVYMKLIMIAGKIFLNVLYFFLKFLPTKNQIVFISRQSNSPTLDFIMLKDEISKKCDYKIVMITRKMKKNKKDIIKNSDAILKEMYYLATSKICVTDGYNIPISVLKHKRTLKVFQLWHSLGAIKKFGYQSLNSPKKKMIANIMRMHKNYDYIITGSEEMTKYFMKAFGYDETVFYPVGLPRIDYINNKKNQKQNKKVIYNQYPDFKKKKVILYVPTFRDNKNYKINELIDSVTSEEYILIVKAHPNMKVNIKEKKNIYTCDEFNSLELLSISDYIITDYSAISIEASILEKPIYLYCYDYKEYSSYPGINTDLKKEFKNYFFTDAKKLFKKIRTGNYDINIVKEYKRKYVCNTSGTVTSNLANLIIERGTTNDKKH